MFYSLSLHLVTCTYERVPYAAAGILVQCHVQPNLSYLLQATVTYSSTYVLVALSIDRYDAITHPMNFSGSCKYSFILWQTFIYMGWILLQ